MNILVLTSREGTGGHPIFCSNVLSEFGNNVSILSTSKDNPSRIFQRRYSQWRHLGKWGKLIINAQIHRAISENNIDVLLIMSNVFLHPSALKLIKKRGVKIVLWEGNLAFNKAFQREAIPFYDLIIIGDTYILPFLRDVMGCRNIHCAQGYGMPSEFYPLCPTDEEKKRFGGDVSFIGKYFPNRGEFFSKLGFPVKIWGNRWNLSGLPDAGQIMPLPPENKRLVFCSSKINLNLKAGNQQINHFSTRIYEVPLCGAFVLSEWSKDLVDLFEDGKEIVTFKSPSEAREKIEYFLEREDERREITNRLRDKIMSKYLLKDTVTRVNELLQKL